MRRFPFRGGFLARAATLAALVGLAGCESTSAPSVSGSNTEVTVHGVVTYKGKPVSGVIKFDPANIARKDAKMVSAPIGADGTYTIKTLQGENRVAFDIPSLKQEASVVSAMFPYDAPAGDSTHDFDLSAQ